MDNTAASPLVEKKARDSWFDNAKAFLIILVVLGHFSEIIISYTNKEPFWLKILFEFIYVFHMPVFMVISGRFAKNRIDKNDWISVINKLIVPYILFQTVMMLVYAFTNYSSVSDFSYLKPLFGIWYILTVAVYQLITPHFKKLKGAFIIAMLIAIIIQFGQDVPFGGFMRFFTYYPFFFFGYMTSGLDLSFCKKSWFRIISLVAFAAMFAIIWLNPDYFGGWALTMRRVYPTLAENFSTLDIEFSYVGFFFYTLAHYVVGFACFFFLMGVSPTKNKFFTFTGKYSMYIYMLHLFIVVSLIALDKKYAVLDFIDSDIKVVLYLVASVVLAFLLASAPVRKAMRWLVEPNFDLRKLAKQLTKE